MNSRPYPHGSSFQDTTTLSGASPRGRWWRRASYGPRPLRGGPIIGACHQTSKMSTADVVCQGSGPGMGAGPDGVGCGDASARGARSARARHLPAPDAAIARALRPGASGAAGRRHAHRHVPRAVSRCSSPAARGCHLWDADGHQYLDVLNNFTSLVHGHGHTAVVRAIADQAAQGHGARHRQRAAGLAGRGAVPAGAVGRARPLLQLGHRGDARRAARRQGVHRAGRRSSRWPAAITVPTTRCRWASRRRSTPCRPACRRAPSAR